MVSTSGRCGLLDCGNVQQYTLKEECVRLESSLLKLVESLIIFEKGRVTPLLFGADGTLAERVDFKSTFAALRSGMTPLYMLIRASRETCVRSQGAPTSHGIVW